VLYNVIYSYFGLFCFSYVYCVMTSALQTFIYYTYCDWFHICKDLTEGEINHIISYLINVLGLAPLFLYETRRFPKFRPSTLVSVYSGVMFLTFLFTRLEMIFGNIFMTTWTNFSTFVARMKISK
jgi:hypothetical protein